MTAILTAPDGRAFSLTKLSFRGRQVLPPPAALVLALTALSGGKRNLGLAESWATRIALTAIMQAADLPRARNGGAERRHKELADLSNQAKSVARTRAKLLSMHREALGQIEEAGADARHPLIIADDLERIEAELQAHIAAVAATSSPSASMPQSSAKIGPAEVARMCGRAFNSLTGSPGTIRSKDGVAYGPFLELVRVAFQELSIDASAEHYARAAGM